MNKTFMIIILLLAVLFACKKQTVAPVVDYDKANSVFRVLIDSNVKDSISIVETFPDGVKVDTIERINGTSSTEFNFGFTPEVGAKIIVNSFGQNAKVLNCTIAYKGIRLGLDSVAIVSKGLNAHFEYNVVN